MASNRVTMRYSKANKETGLMPSEIERMAYSVPLAALKAPQWLLVPKTEQHLLERMATLPHLSSIAGAAQLGVKTSLNEVFVIDDQLASELVAKDKTAKVVLRPFTRGRDISRWYTRTNGTHLVRTREAISIDDFPSIKSYLKKHEDSLRNRYEVKRGDYEWWVIRQVAHTDIFEKPKIMYPDLASRSKFGLNDDGSYPSNTAFCIPTNNIALLAYLNSPTTFGQRRGPDNGS